MAALPMFEAPGVFFEKSGFPLVARRALAMQASIEPAILGDFTVDRQVDRGGGSTSENGKNRLVASSPRG
jgi:hypothetical protein